MIKYETYLPNKCWLLTQTKASTNFVRSDFDYGVRQRRAVRGRDTQSAIIVLTRLDLPAWKSFWFDLNDGTDKFLTDQWVNLDDTIDKTVRFTAGYTVNEKDYNTFEITIPVELIETGTST